MESANDITAYYRATLHGLRFVEARRATGRRFGAEADARWAAFRGDLTTADRIDLMIRDADAQWPRAFGARTVFVLRAVAEDEPFGMGWAGLDPVDAEDLWREHTMPAHDDVRGTVDAVARSWGTTLNAFDVGKVDATEKFVVAGASAIAALIAAFAAGRDLDWTDQVVVVATAPAPRQLGALASALLNAGSETRFVEREADIPAGSWRVVVSDDANEADAHLARRIGRLA